jgi:hypothetical protein
MLCPGTTEQMGRNHPGFPASARAFARFGLRFAAMRRLT